MDNWKKYIQENEGKLSIEEVDEKVWQNVYESAVPKKRSFITKIRIGVSNFINLYATRKEGFTVNRTSNKFRLAYTLVFVAFVTASFAFKVKINAKYGDLVTFSIAKEAYHVNHDTYVKSVFNSFSTITNPTDPGSFLLIKCIRENNETKKVISHLKVEDGVSNLVVTPILFEIKESLFSAFLNKAFEIQMNERMPNEKQVKNKINDLLNQKGLTTVDIQIDKSQEISFSSKTSYREQSIQSDEDSVAISNEIADRVNVANKTDTIPLKPSTKDSGVDGSKSNLKGWKNDLALMTSLTKALEKDGLVDGSKRYELEVKNGDLYINEKKQSKEVSDKYRMYFKDDNYTITSDGDLPKPNLTFNDAPKEVPKTRTPNSDRKEPNWDPVQYKKELRLMNLLIDGLVKDGLIARNKPYTVNIKDGELYIDNIKQPKEVTDKFRQYFSGKNYGFMND